MALLTVVGGPGLGAGASPRSGAGEGPLEVNPLLVVYQEPGLSCHSPAASTIPPSYSNAFLFFDLYTAWAIPSEKLV